MNSTNLDPKLRHEIQRLAEAAGREIMRVYRSDDRSVTIKGDTSPLTQADIAANNVLMPGLRQLTTAPIVSEESDPQSVIVQDDFWLVDPLDGTRDFINRTDSFVVCIARVVNGEPVFGLIHAPVSGLTWWAAKAEGAFGPGDVRLDHRSTRTPWIAVGSRAMASERMRDFLSQHGIGEIQRFGSALKFCKLAEGEVDLYPRFGPTSEWDTAAGQIIAEEAGCRVLSIATGSKLSYGKPAFENRGGFIAARADIDIVPAVQALIARYKITDQT